MNRKRKKRNKECEQRKPDIDNKECVKAYDEYACENTILVKELARITKH